MTTSFESHRRRPRRRRAARLSGNTLGIVRRGRATTENEALYRLLAWLSPSYPIGGFSYSHGLETAIEEGLVDGLETLTAWLTDIIEQGSGRNDGLFLCAAYKAAADDNDDDSALLETAELAAAFQPTAELFLETTTQGRAFLDTTSAAWPTATLERLRQVQKNPLALVVGVAAAGHGLSLSATLHGYLHAFVANLVSAGLRLVPLGQTDGQRAIAAMESVIANTASEVLALENPLDHLASNTVINDWCSMRHETQYTRLFRS